MLLSIIRILEKSDFAYIDPGRIHGSVASAADKQQPTMMIEVTSGPFKGMRLPTERADMNGHHIFRNYIKTFLITHAHLDHLSGLVMNSPLIQMNAPKTIAALPTVIAALKTHLFNDVLWPNLSDEDGPGLISYKRLREGERDDRYTKICKGLSARCCPISHGSCGKKHGSVGTGYQPVSETDDTSREPQKVSVESSAVFIREHTSGSEIIIFGDLEPDSISENPRNRRVWEQAATKFVEENLRAIFIECSYSDETKDQYLFGHMCPRHLIAELEVLAGFVREKKEQARLDDIERDPREYYAPSALSSDDLVGTESLTSSEEAISTMPLNELKVFVIHVKEEFASSKYPREAILAQLIAHSRAKILGIEFRAVESGNAIYL